VRIALAAALILVRAPAAHAATWKPVTAAGGAGIDEVGHVRTADGVLHAVGHTDGDLTSLPSSS